MKTIYKFPLTAQEKQTVMMPEGAEILCAQSQGKDHLPLGDDKYRNHATDGATHRGIRDWLADRTRTAQLHLDSTTQRVCVAHL